MEVSRLRLLFLIGLAGTTLQGCALFGGDRNSEDSGQVAQPVPSDPQSDQPVIEPEVERREIRRPKIEAEDFEIGAYYGVLSIEDFESNTVQGARLAYHISEDFFLEASIAESDAGRTSFEKLGGGVDLLTPDERDYSYYALSIGWNALPGEVFVGKNRAYNTAFYVVGGIGSTTFASDERFTVSGGFGFRVLPSDRITVHFDVRDYVFDSDVLGDKKLVNNLEAHLGLSVFF
jgi:outer membrane beta-barrel protein